MEFGLWNFGIWSYWSDYVLYYIEDTNPGTAEISVPTQKNFGRSNIQISVVSQFYQTFLAHTFATCWQDQLRRIKPIALKQKQSNNLEIMFTKTIFTWKVTFSNALKNLYCVAGTEWGRRRFNRISRSFNASFVKQCRTTKHRIRRRHWAMVMCAPSYIGLPLLPFC